MCKQVIKINDMCTLVSFIRIFKTEFSSFHSYITPVSPVYLYPSILIAQAYFPGESPKRIET